MSLILNGQKVTVTANCRRLRVHRVFMGDMSHLFFQGKRILLRVDSPIPIDAVHKHTFHDADHICFVYEHPSFEDVREGDVMPDLTGHVCYEWLDAPYSIPDVSNEEAEGVADISLFVREDARFSWAPCMKVWGGAAHRLVRLVSDTNSVIGSEWKVVYTCAYLADESYKYKVLEAGAERFYKRALIMTHTMSEWTFPDIQDATTRILLLNQGFTDEELTWKPKKNS